MPDNAKPSLLIVDDDPLITETLSYALGKDFEVMVSDSRQHAVSLLRQLDEAPQLALVDLGLPPAPHRPDEGFQLISDLLAHSPAMKILVLSGQNDAANARHARTLGAAEFVAKPCDPENLKKILLHALQFRAAEISGEGIALDIVPRFEAQENVSRRTAGLHYWEGAVKARDTGGSEAGQGYVELTGYGEGSRSPL